MFERLKSIKVWLDEQPEKLKKEVNTEENIEVIRVESMRYYTRRINELFKKHGEKSKIYSMNKNAIKGMNRLNLKNYFYNEYYGIAKLVKEPGNKHDKNAIKVMVNDIQVGYISRDDQHIINKNRIKQAEIAIRGGKYKVWKEIDGELVSEIVEDGYYANLNLTK